MLDSISNIFSLPTITRNKYKDQPSLQHFLRQNKISKYPLKQPFRDPNFDGLIDCLKNPIEEWILQEQPHLKTHAANRAIFDLVIQNCLRSKLKLQQPNKITVHNLFVLMVQYEVLGELIKDMGMRQLQMFIDGVCGLQIRGTEDSIEELTCILHHILRKRQASKKQKNKCRVNLLRPLNVENIPLFIEIYGNLPKRLQKKFYDSVPRVIPMLAELLKMIIGTGDGQKRHAILKEIPWVHQIAGKLLGFICKDVKDIVNAHIQSTNLSTLDYQNEQNPQLRKNLLAQASSIQLLTCLLSGKELFAYACRQLYYFQHIIRLQKFMMKLVPEQQGLRSQRQDKCMAFITEYLKVSLKYDFNIPDNHTGYITEMMKLMRFESKIQMQRLAPFLQKQPLKAFIQTIEGYNKYQWQNRQKASGAEHISYCLEKDESLLYYLLKSIYYLRLDHLTLIAIILERIHKRYRIEIQYYLVKNGFLHLLIEEQLSVQGSEGKGIKLYFQIVSELVKGNTFTYCILDEILKEALEKSKKSRFVDYIRKNFYQSKTFLLNGLADTISTNSRHKGQQYFIPFYLQLLLYPQSKNNPKHDIWISYIHDVIIRQLKRQKERLQLSGDSDALIDEDISQWVTIAIMIQIECVMFKRGQDFELGEFTMNYMTNILNEAIKWKYEDETSVMRRILDNYQQWQTYYTELILSTENNVDVIESAIGPVVNFLFLKRWNRKICNSINIFIESVLTTDVSDSLF